MAGSTRFLSLATPMSGRWLAALAVLSLVVASTRAGGQDRAPLAAPAPGVDTVPVVRAPADSNRVHEYRGAYSTGFEMSWFEPCDAPRGDALWWVTLTEDARLQRDSLLKLLPRKPTQGLAVQWRATVSPVMRSGAGQMGRGSRYVLVTRILSLRALGDEGACGPPGSSGE
jgi:hypothetical protein